MAEGGSESNNTAEELKVKEANETHEPGYVIARVGVENLKGKNKFYTWLSGFIGKPPEATNAHINPGFESRSFHLRVEGSGTLEGKTFELHVRRLKHEIDKAGSYYKIKDGRILLYLKKTADMIKSNTLWYPEDEPFTGTLETYTDSAPQ